MKKSFVGAAALLVAIGLLGAEYRAPRPKELAWPSVAEQLQERRGRSGGIEDSYLISDISRGSPRDSVFELPFRYHGDSVELAIEAWWDVPRGRHAPDSIGRKRWRGVTVSVTPEEMLAVRCVGAAGIDSMLVVAVARPQRADTFATPRLAWRVDTATRTFVPLSPAGLRCPTTPYFSDAVVTGSVWRDAKYAVTLWWDDVRMMVGRIAANHQRGSTRS